MALDYAKNRARNTHGPKQKSHYEGWLIALLVMVILGGLYWLYLPKLRTAMDDHTFSGAIAHFKSMLTHKKTVRAKTTTNTQQEPEVQFDFYEALPNMQVAITPPPVSAPALPKENLPKENNTAHYVLQFGVFKTMSDASQARISLLLAGIDANIIKNTAGSYSVQQGSFTDLNSAKSTLEQFKKKGMMAEIVKK